MENYFEESERLDWEKFLEFNNGVLHLVDVGKTPSKHWTDASGYTMTGRYFNIELKSRNQILTDDLRISGCSKNGKSYIDDTLFIEDHKISDMLLDSIEGKEPIYINFLGDGSVIIFHLNKLTIRPKRFVNLKIKSDGYNKMEFGNRQGLYLKDATIYLYKDNEYRLVKRSGQ